MGFLRFLLLCFDFLAWPTFALGYPLWASIRAIETSSKYHMKKLVAYWTIFSLISIFEITFAKLVQWAPFWPYIKLIAICWLVIPDFNGACQVYQCLVHPCLALSLQNVMDWCCYPEKNLSTKETFLASAEAYLKENGSEALEKLLIASKAYSKEYTGLDDLQVVKRVEPTVNDVAAEEQLVKHPLPDPDQTDKKIESAKVQNVAIPSDGEEKRSLEIPAGLMKAQREWTCAMCQVTTSSESNLNSHLQGKKHKLKCEELKINIEAAKTMRSSAEKADDPSQANKKPKNCPPGEGLKPKITKRREKISIPAASGQCTPENPKKQDARPAIPASKFLCGVCNIACPKESNLAAHLKGKKHMKQIQSLNILQSGGKA